MRSIAERVREATEALPAEKQAEVLDFVEFLRSRSSLPSESEAVRKAQLRAERFGALRDAFTIAPDFDAPLPEEIQLRRALHIMCGAQAGLIAVCRLPCASFVRVRALDPDSEARTSTRTRTADEDGRTKGSRR